MRIKKTHKTYRLNKVRSITKRKTIKNYSRKSWGQLTANQKSGRILSLKVLSRMRKRKSLVRSAIEFGISLVTVKAHLKSAIRKKGKRWIAKSFDKIQRAMVISTKGESISIIVTNSKDASLIGKYHNAVKKFLETGDESLLKPFKNKKLKDAKGKWHVLETDPRSLYDIAEAREDSEFYDIYGESYE